VQNIRSKLIHISIRYLKPQSLLSSITPNEPTPPAVNDTAPSGYVKSILPCTPLAIVKCLEHIGVYNKILPYGDRAYGKTVTVINRLLGLELYDDPMLTKTNVGRRWSGVHWLRSWLMTVHECSPSISIQFRYLSCYLPFLTGHSFNRNLSGIHETASPIDRGGHEPLPPTACRAPEHTDSTRMSRCL
jgi:hypothetical protein